MKYLILIFLSSFLLTNCENRGCECDDDMRFIWENESEATQIDIILPNAVLNSWMPLSFCFYSMPQSNWQIHYIKIHQGNNVFVETGEASNYLYGKILTFPQDELTYSNGQLVKGAVTIEVVIFFPDLDSELNIEGTIYFYDCEDIDQDFGLEECRWSKDCNVEYFQRPC